LSVFSRGDDEFTRGARTALVIPETRASSSRSQDARRGEMIGLANAIALEVALVRELRVRDIKPGSFLGAGQIETLAQDIAAEKIDLVILDGSLSAVQQRNLEDSLGAKVIDRTGLILEIFGERAASAEGRLQVELAHLDHQQGRLVRSWTHLERQRGGFGFLGGPGETQIEADRRTIRDRMARLRRELETVKRTRSLHRSRRQRAPWPIVALVGYTNAGKSTLFNQLTGGDVLAADMLFATLDPTMRRFSIPGIDKAIVSDTVGFVSNLPTELVAAFRATLEEVLAADIIVHVRDIAHDDSDQQRDDVLEVLGELGLSFEGDSARGYVEVFNKIDLLSADDRAAVIAAAEQRDDTVALSAFTGESVERLGPLLSRMLTMDRPEFVLTLAMSDGERRAWLHQHGEVVSEIANNDTVELTVRLSREDHARFVKRLDDLS